MKIGTRSQVLTRAEQEALPLAHELGFAGVEFSVSARQPDNSLLWHTAGRRLLDEQRAATGVAVCSLCIGNCGFMLTQDEETYQRGLAVGEAIITYARELDAPLILCAMDAPPTQPYEESFSRWVAGLQALAPHAERAGVTLALESVGRTHPQSVARFRELLAAVASPAVGVYFDVGNAYGQGFDPAADLLALGAHVRQIHIKEPNRIPLLGEGPLDFAAIFAAIRAIGYDGWLVLETAPGDNPRAAAQHNRAFVEDWLQTIDSSSPTGRGKQA